MLRVDSPIPDLPQFVGAGACVLPSIYDYSIELSCRRSTACAVVGKAKEDRDRDFPDMVSGWGCGKCGDVGVGVYMGGEIGSGGAKYEGQARISHGKPAAAGEIMAGEIRASPHISRVCMLHG